MTTTIDIDPDVTQHRQVASGLDRLADAASGVTQREALERLRATTARSYRLSSPLAGEPHFLIGWITGLNREAPGAGVSVEELAARVLGVIDGYKQARDEAAAVTA